MSSTISHTYSTSSPPKPPRLHLHRSSSDPSSVSDDQHDTQSAPPQQIYVLSADGSRLFLLDPSKPANEEPPPYAPFQPSPNPGPGHLNTRSLSSANIRHIESGPSSPRRLIDALVSPVRYGQATLLPPDDDTQTRHRASTLSALGTSRPVRPTYRSSVSRPQMRSAASSPGISHRTRIADETTPLLGGHQEQEEADTRSRRGFWRSTFCGDLDAEEEPGTWGKGWKRYWRPWSRKAYWNAALHLILLNFPFVSSANTRNGAGADCQALLIWPWLVVGTLVGTALLITLPIGAAVWWITLFLSRSSARLEVRTRRSSARMRF